MSKLVRKFATLIIGTGMALTTGVASAAPDDDRASEGAQVSKYSTCSDNGSDTRCNYQHVVSNRVSTGSGNEIYQSHTRGGESFESGSEYAPSYSIDTETRTHTLDKEEGQHLNRYRESTSLTGDFGNYCSDRDTLYVKGDRKVHRTSNQC